MKRFFSKITTSHWEPKNKAHAEVLEFIETMDARIINENELETFQTEFYKGIEAINSKHKRCKDFKLYHWTPAKELVYTVSQVFWLTLYKVK